MLKVSPSVAIPARWGYLDSAVRMAATSSASLRRGLVADLERLGVVRSPAIRRAILRVPRELFVPEIAAHDGLARVYANRALMTRGAQGGQPTSSSSQPSIMAEMLERVELRPGHRVLEIGAGTGYNAALLSTLVMPGGKVTSVELQWDLAEKASGALSAGGFEVDVVVGDAQLGRFGDGQFDRIIATASTDHIPRAWFEQLRPEGLIVAPMRIAAPGPWQQLVVAFQKAGDRLLSVGAVWGGFMHLRSAGDRGGEMQPPQVSVSEVIDGRHHMFGNLVGHGLARMKPAARRRLTELLLTRPRARPIATPGSASVTLLPFVAMSDQRAGVLVAHVGDAGRGMGMATRDGRSLSLVVAGENGRCRMLSFGEEEASGILHGEITRWQAEGRPSVAEWFIEVSFGGRPSARHGARVLERGQCWMAVTWPQATAHS